MRWGGDWELIYTIYVKGWLELFPLHHLHHWAEGQSSTDSSIYSYAWVIGANSEVISTTGFIYTAYAMK